MPHRLWDDAARLRLIGAKWTRTVRLRQAPFRRAVMHAATRMALTLKSSHVETARTQSARKSKIGGQRALADRSAKPAGSTADCLFAVARARCRHRAEAFSGSA